MRAPGVAPGLPAFGIFRLGRLRNAYMLRGLAVWIGIRLAAALFGLVQLTPLGAVFVLGAVASGTYLDARRRDEDVFLGNLGIPRAGILLASLPIPLVLELVLA